MRTLGSTGWEVAKFTGRAADKAAGGVFRWMTTDHSGIEEALNRMHKMGFLDTVSYVLTHFLIAVAGSILGAVLVFILVAFGIPFLIGIIL
jgi:hypothetical protein